jgi:RNA polymerase sigma-70 factor (ECF subfamily)
MADETPMTDATPVNGSEGDELSRVAGHNPLEAQPQPPRGRFPDTRWSVVLGAAGPDGNRALAELCRLYWAPVHDFFCRLGCNHEIARDRTQDFFARMIERNDLSRLDRSRVRWFRSWLRTCVRNYYLNQLKFERAQKRHPGTRTASFTGDELPLPSELGHRLSTDQALDRVWDQCWSRALVERAVERLSEHKTVRSRWPLFLELVSTMNGQPTPTDDAAIAAQLGIKIDSVRVYRFKVRAAFKECLARELAAVPDASKSLREEHARLLAAYGGAGNQVAAHDDPLHVASKAAGSWGQGWGMGDTENLSEAENLSCN